MSKFPNHVLFWGVGSIGSLFGGLLKYHYENDFNIQFLGRNPHIGAIQKKGVKIFKRSELKFTTPPISGFAKLPDKFEKPADIIFITCKTRDNVVAASDLKNREIVGKNTKLVIIQNGVGNEEQFLDLVPKSNIYRIITTEGALVLGPGKIMHSGPGTTLIGKPYENCYDHFSKNLAEWFSSSGLESKVTNYIRMKTWDKVLINAPINPIATLYNVRNGELVTRPHLRKMVEDVVDETVTILKERKLPFDKEINPLESVLNVAKATAENKCSMLQDIEKGRRTEIDSLNGRLIYEANLAGIPAPLNISLTSKIKELETNLT